MLRIDRLVSRHQYRHDGNQHARRPNRRKRDKDIKVNKGSATQDCCVNHRVFDVADNYQPNANQEDADRHGKGKGSASLSEVGVAGLDVHQQFDTRSESGGTGEYKIVNVAVGQ